MLSHDRQVKYSFAQEARLGTSVSSPLPSRYCSAVRDYVSKIWFRVSSVLFAVSNASCLASEYKVFTPTVWLCGRKLFRQVLEKNFNPQSALGPSLDLTR